MKTVKFVKNGYQTIMEDDMAKIYEKKKKVEIIEEKKETAKKAEK